MHLLGALLAVLSGATFALTNATGRRGVISGTPAQGMVISMPVGLACFVPFAVVTGALLPLVPGLAIYQGLLQMVGTEPGLGDPTAGGGTLLVALGVAISIGAGASLGIFLGRPLVDTVRRITFRRRRSTEAAS